MNTTYCLIIYDNNFEYKIQITLNKIIEIFKVDNTLWGLGYGKIRITYNG